MADSTRVEITLIARDLATADFQRLRREAQALGGDLQKLTQQAGDAARGFTRLRPVNLSSDEIRRFQQEVARLNQEVVRAQQQAAQQAQQNARAMTAAHQQALTAARALSQGQQFSISFRDRTPEQIEEIRQRFERLGANVRVILSQATEGRRTATFRVRPEEELDRQRIAAVTRSLEVQRPITARATVLDRPAAEAAQRAAEAVQRAAERRAASDDRQAQARERAAQRVADADARRAQASLRARDAEERATERSVDRTVALIQAGADREDRIREQQRQRDVRREQQRQVTLAAVAARAEQAGQLLAGGRPVVFETAGRSEEQLVRMRDNLRSFGVEVERVGQRVTQTGQRVSSFRLTPPRGGLGIDAAALTREFSAVEATGVRTFSSIGSQATRVGLQVAQGLGHATGVVQSFGAGLGVAAATTAAAVAIANLTSQYADFEKQVRGTNALLGQSGSAAERSFQGIQHNVRQFGVELGIGATPAAKALYEVLSAGIPTGRQAFEVLDVSARAAIGGLTDTQTAVDGITSVLNAYRLSADQASRVSDQMFQTVNIGKITFQQLSQEIGTTAPLAAALGVRFSEVGGAIATATQQGLRSGQAIEGLRATLNAFLKPSQGATDLAAALGVEFDANAIKGKGFQRALEDVVKATGGSQKLLGELLGDVQAINFAFAVSGQNASAFAQAIRQVENSAGSTDRAFEQVDASLARSFDRAKAAFDDLGLSIGEVTAGPLARFLDAITGAMKSLTPQRSKQSQETLDFYNDLADAAGTASERIRSLEQQRQQQQQRGAILTNLFTQGVFGAAPALQGIIETRQGIAQLSERQRYLQQLPLAQREFNAMMAAGTQEQIKLNNARRDGTLSTEEYTQKTNELNTKLGQIAQAEAQGNELTITQIATQREAAAAFDAHGQEVSRLTERYAELFKTAAPAQKALASAAEQSAGRAEQEALRQLREGLQDREQAAQREAERGQRVLEDRARTLQEAAEKSRDALQALRDSAADARGELEELNKVRVTGTAAGEERVFAAGTRAARAQLVIEEARLARMQARAAGLPPPPVDRTALRAAAREQAVAEQEARVEETRNRALIEPENRAIAQILNPPQEMAVAELRARAQAARTRVEEIEGPDPAAFQTRLRTQEAVVRSMEREAQAAQRAAQEQSRADQLRLQAQKDQNEQTLRAADAAARAAEAARQRAEYEKNLQVVLDARAAFVEQERAKGTPEEEIQKRLATIKELQVPTLPTGAAGTIIGMGAAAGVEIQLPEEFNLAAKAQAQAAADQTAASAVVRQASDDQKAAAATQTQAATVQTTAAATGLSAAQQMEKAAIEVALGQKSFGEGMKDIIAAQMSEIARVLGGIPSKTAEREPGITTGPERTVPGAEAPPTVASGRGAGLTTGPLPAPVPTVTAAPSVAGTGVAPAITIASGAINIDMSGTTVDSEERAQSLVRRAMDATMDMIQTEFSDAASTDLAGSRYGR